MGNSVPATNAILTLSLATANIAALEVAKLKGYDGITLDLEHSPFNRESVDLLILVARLAGLRSYARVAAPSRIDIQHALDSGADGVIIPHVENLAHARELSSFAKYPPLGDRSVPSGRTWDYGDPPGDWVNSENRRISCFPMIETAGALDDVEAILEVEAVDGVFLGPFDLNMSRGRRGIFGIDDVADRGRIAEAAKKSGKHWGMYVYTDADLTAAKELGLTFAALPDDITALMEALGRNIQKARAALGSRP